jgi:hypothetical protein
MAKKGQKPAPGTATPLKSPVFSLLFAIPSHPCVDMAEGAAGKPRRTPHRLEFLERVRREERGGETMAL